MEDNIQEVAVEEAVVQEAETPVDTSVSEPMAETQVIEDNSLDIDFSDLAPQQQYVAPVQERDIVEEITERLANRLQPQQPNPYIDQAEPEVVTKAELQAMFQQMQEQKQAEAFIAQTIAQSRKVEEGYVSKLTDTLAKNGIDLETNPDLKMSADLLYRQMYQQKLQQLNRTAAVLTAEETHELVQQHFKTFNQVFLQNKIQKKAQTVQNLSPAGNAAPHQGQTAKAPDEYSQFLEKKKQGTLTMKDIANILAKPTQKK